MNVRKLFKLLIFINFSLYLANCATFLDFKKPLEEVTLEKPVDLKIDVKPGYKEIIKYYTMTKSKTYQDTLIAHEKIEEMEFTTQTEVTKIDEKGNIHINLSVLEKDGLMDLHDMGFPEKGEILEMIYTPKGKVLKAGYFPKNSVFFVPSVSYPKDPVKKGDTWIMDSNWISIKTSLQLKLALTSILKKFVKCGENDICSDIEISGKVNFATDIYKDFVFNSNLKGKILLSNSTGSLIWSEIFSTEKFHHESLEINVQSCLSSHIEEPKNKKIAGINKVKCEFPTKKENKN